MLADAKGKKTENVVNVEVEQKAVPVPLYVPDYNKLEKKQEDKAPSVVIEEK